jgi:hypothetical protein
VVLGGRGRAVTHVDLTDSLAASDEVAPTALSTPHAAIGQLHLLVEQGS